MTVKIRAAFICYILAIAIIATLALIYLLAPKLLPYQEQAIGATWTELKPGLQYQFLSLLKVAGGGYLATASALAILLFIPFKKGEAWSRWAMTAIGIPAILIVNYAGLIIISNTPGRPPLIAGPIAIILLITGLILSADMNKHNNHLPS